MTARSMVLEATGLTDKGFGRQENEDAFLVDIQRGLFAVADGMGGHEGGYIAAHAIVEQLAGFVDRQFVNQRGQVRKRLRNAVLDLSAAIRKSGGQIAGLQGMGATLAGLLVWRGYAYIVSMGDSRVYRWRGGLTCLTEDHSVTGLLVREGEISTRSAAWHPARGQLTRYVGMEQEIYPDVFCMRIASGDRFLLCTDGLWNALPDRQIASVLAEHRGPNPACARMIDAAKEKNVQDNVTCVIVTCDKSRHKSSISKNGVA
jgi:serine/threonine protein phosphatase PrpC